MNRWLVILSFLLLLTGCSTMAASVWEPSGKAPDAARTAAEGESVTVLSIPLSEMEPYEPWESMEPDVVSIDAMGQVLCDETLPDGTEVICFWEDSPGSGVKYWAIRRGDNLLRFCREESCYTEGYGVSSFTDVLGHDGFRIVAPRGAAYTAYDYYVLDDTGTPRLLADCANYVLEIDFDSDGVTELLWFYHGGQEIYYYTLLDGQVCSADIIASLSDASPIYFCGSAPGLLEENTSLLPVTYLPCGGTPWDETVAYVSLSAQLCFAPEAVEFQIPAGQLWTMDRYALRDGVPCVTRSGETEWTPLGPAVPAPREWAGQDPAGREEAETWAGLEPAFTALQMVSAGDGWLVLSIGQGAAGMDTYIYQTHDGGKTWEEAAPLPEGARKPFKAAFPDGEHAVIAAELFDSAPAYVTADGGKTWSEADLPLPETDSVWNPEGLSLDGETVWLHMRAIGENGSSYVETFLSPDGGETWSREPMS